MQFNLEKSIEILERTPGTLIGLLKDLDPAWTSVNEGEKTWSAWDVVGHLVYGEKTDWIPRTQLILSNKEDKTFEPFDQLGHVADSKGKTLAQLLDEFKSLRKKNIEHLRSANLTDVDLAKKGIHPEFREITLSQMLSTWVVHDLNHLAQIARVMARQYEAAVGPWTKYLRILRW